MTVLEWWGLWGLKVLDVAWLSSFPVHFSGSCWSETGSGLWHIGMNDVWERSGECGMGCDYPHWMHHGTNGNGGIHQLKGGINHCSGLMKSMMFTF